MPDRGGQTSVIVARMPELITPTGRLQSSWLAARDEWPLGAHQDGTGLRLAPESDLDRPEVFSAWVERLQQQSDRSVDVGEGRVHATHWWIVEGDSYLGAIDLRHYLNAFLLDVGGHIGYNIPPPSRRRGLATMGPRAGFLRGPAVGVGPGPGTLDGEQ